MHVTIDLEGNTLTDLRSALAGLAELPAESTFVVRTARTGGGALRGNIPDTGTRFGSPLVSITATTPRGTS